MIMDRTEAVERCSQCRQSKPIVKRLPGGFVTGSAMKRRPLVLICADCDPDIAVQYAASQRRHAANMVTMIEGMITETPSLAEKMNEHLDIWKGRTK